MSRPPKACTALRDERRRTARRPAGRIRRRRTEPARSRVQLLRERVGFAGGAAVVQHDIRAGRVQHARDGRAHAPRRPGDQHRLARRGLSAGTGRRVCRASWVRDYDVIAARSMLPPLSPRGAAPQRRRVRGADPRARSRARGRLAVLRALHGARAVCAGAGLLQRRQRQTRCAAGTSSPPPKSRICSAAAWRASAPRCSPADGGQILELGAGSGRIAAALLTALEARGRAARALRDPRSQRGPGRTPAHAPRAAAATPAGRASCG